MPLTEILRLPLLWFCSAALLLGILQRTSPALESPEGHHLLDLHLHGSFSEGQATMASHTAQAELSGFDALWWTDHMERLIGDGYRHAVAFEGDLDGSVSFGDQVSVRRMESDPGNLAAFDATFDALHAWQGNQSLVLAFASAEGGTWQEGRLTYRAENKSESVSLAAEPHVRLSLRLKKLVGEAGVAVRLTLSSVFDQGLPEGRPRVVYFLPQGCQVEIPAGAEVVTLPALPPSDWIDLDCDLKAAIAPLWDPVEDLSLKKVELVLGARAGGRMVVQVDDFSIQLEGPTDGELFRIQAETLAQHYSARIAHHVGAEMGGPYSQEIAAISTRDHLITLFPQDLEEVARFPEGSPEALAYPRSGVEWTHDRHGVAILAHLFGADATGEELEESIAETLIRRLVDERAFGADGIEVGYYHRGRGLRDLVEAWDRLSERGIFLTGVGSSDNHNLEVWEQRTNRMATWIQAPSLNPTQLCAALKGGRAFFGDPFLFDPDGRLHFAQAQGAYRMGQAVVATGMPQDLTARISGAPAGSVLVFLHNGEEVHRWPFQGPTLEVTRTCDPQPGDWVRLEVRDAADDPFLFSNPIYYLAAGQVAPPARRP